MIIYEILNKKNGKVYIGQHCGSKDQRWKQHLAASLKIDNPLPLYRAMRKYGIDNFEYKVIEEIPLSKGPEFLNEREIYWIKEKKSYIGENGYNVTRGGQGAVAYYCDTERKKKLSDSLDKKNYGQYDPLTGKLIKIWEKGKDLRDAGFWPGHAQHASKWHTGKETTRPSGKKYMKTTGGYMWLVLDNGETFPNVLTPLGSEKGNYGKKRVGQRLMKVDDKSEISQYSLSGYLINTFPNNINQVVQDTGITTNTIRNALKGKTRVGGGYQWRVFPKNESPDKIDSELVQSEIKFSKRELSSKPVVKVLDGRDIFVYQSVIDALLDNNLKPIDIMVSIQNGDQDPKGFTWRWKD